MNLDKKDVSEESSKTVIIKHDFKQLTIIALIAIAGVLGYNGVQGWGWFLFVALMCM